ncbi:MAG: CpaF family protein, partial [Gemmatimonadetes bacterium]|nr:CpaF family protein [Gemmatimonadota bacterium]
LPDGSRINVVIPPLVDSPTITIRKFLLRNRSLDQLVRDGTLSAEAADYLTIATRAGLNIILFGATGTGKTTFIGALVDAINNLDERVITIEETRELDVANSLPDAIAMQARMRGIDDDGRGAVSVRDLTKTTLRMRPSRIIVGEARGAEALDMLVAMTSGHEGSMTTLHADSPHGALQKLKLYVMMAGEELPHDAINEMIAEAIHLVIHLRQDRKSRHRYVNSIFEVKGLEHHARGSTFIGQDIFVRRGGDLVWTGIPSEFREKLLDGIDPEEESDDLAAGPRRWL